MKGDLYILVAFAFFLAHQATGHLSCRLTSDDGQNEDIRIEGALSQTLIGPPGKMGPQGPPGDVLKCNCSHYDAMAEKIKDLEDRLHRIEGIFF